MKEISCLFCNRVCCQWNQSRLCISKCWGKCKNPWKGDFFLLNCFDSFSHHPLLFCSRLERLPLPDPYCSLCHFSFAAFFEHSEWWWGWRWCCRWGEIWWQCRGRVFSEYAEYAKHNLHDLNIFNLSLSGQQNYWMGLSINSINCLNRGLDISRGMEIHSSLYLTPLKCKQTFVWHIL